MGPKISIITVSFNAVNTIEQTITSVLNQKYNNYEYIIIDGESTDGTVDIIKKYEDKITCWISEQDNGIYDAMNKGIAHANGDYIQIIGADDCFCNDESLTSIVSQLSNDIDILSACEYVIVDGNRQFKYSNAFAKNKDNYRGGMVPHAAMLVKKSIYNKYKFDESYKIVADYKFFLQCYYDDDIKIKFVSDYIVFFDGSGVSSDSVACRQEDERVYRELKLSFNKKTKPKKYKQLIRSLFMNIGIYKYIYNQYLNFFVYEKHRCDNKICRWCRR